MNLSIFSSAIPLRTITVSSHLRLCLPSGYLPFRFTETIVILCLGMQTGFSLCAYFMGQCVMKVPCEEKLNSMRFIVRCKHNVDNLQCQVWMVQFAEERPWNLCQPYKVTWTSDVIRTTISPGDEYKRQNNSSVCVRDIVTKNLWSMLMMLELQYEKYISLNSGI